jgi:uncharacterized protein YlxW (UPF0749 family)
MLSDVERAPEPADDADRAEGANGANRANRRRLSWGLLVPVVTASAGLMFAMSFEAARGGDLRADRDLPALILAGDTRNKDKGAYVDELSHEVEQLSTISQDPRLTALAKSNEKLAQLAATTKVTGPAIEVSLDDSSRSLESFHGKFTPDDIVVHQQDVQGVVNALWSAGAEAMMIQDQRVISTSAVRCVGNTLILQGRVYAPPYTIKAIGDIDAMQRALDNSPDVQTYKTYVDEVGLGYAVHHLDSVEFPAYSGSVDLQHARALR